jgi:hypothetical protein
MQIESYKPLYSWMNCVLQEPFQVEYAVEAYNGILLAAERRRSTKNLLKEAFLNKITRSAS